MTACELTDSRELLAKKYRDDEVLAHLVRYILCWSYEVPACSPAQKNNSPTLTVEFTTYDVTLALDRLNGANIRQHGPFDIQEKREQFMVVKAGFAFWPQESQCFLQFRA